MNARTSLTIRLTGVVGAIAIAFAATSSPAIAAIVVTQSAAPAPTYTTTLNFDEPAGPTGVNVPNNSWAASHNIPVFQSGEGGNFVGDNSADTAQGTNSYAGPFGVFMNFGNDLTSMSFQAWDTSGPPSFFGGGMGVFLINDGDENNPVFAQLFTPNYGGFGGGSWFNITTTAGTVFDEVRVLGFGFSPTTWVDNLSWNAVPEPTSLAMLAMAGLGVLARRRR